MEPKILLLTSNDGTQSGRSGYDVLADYLPAVSTDVVRHPRSDPKGFFQKVLRRMLILRSASRSYLVSSRHLEQKATQYIRAEKPALVHFLWGDRDWGYLDKATRTRGIPLVCTVHGCPDSLEKIFVHADRLRAPQAYVLMSSHQRPFFERRGIGSDRLHVIHHGIDVEFFHPQPELRDASGPFTILSVGHTRRNFPLMKQVIERMKDDDCVFRVISKPAFREEFARYENVRFESNLSNDELLRAYQSASALILTAEDATANNALLEAMACGLPVVAEGVGGLPEYCGQAGFLAPPNDAEALRTHLLQLRDDRALYETSCHAARKRAEELRWEVSAQAVQALYRRLLDAETSA